MSGYHYFLRFNGDGDDAGGTWYIVKSDPSKRYHGQFEGGVAFRCPYQDDEDHDGRPPEALRREYERLIGRGEFVAFKEPQPVNLVEVIADEDECAWDQPCAFGYRVEDHAVYCHNDGWLYAPRKCKRRQRPGIYGDAWLHEECPGFKPNPFVRVSEGNADAPEKSPERG